MSKKYIDVMDTTLGCAVESIYSSRVFAKDILEAVEYASKAGVSHFSLGGGDRFATQLLELNENPFEFMQKFRIAAGSEANLQVLSRSINTFMQDINSSEMIELFATLLAKYEITTVRDYDALNDVNNFNFTSEAIVNSSMMYEVAIGINSYYDLEFYSSKILDMLDNGVIFDSIVFIDSSGTANPSQIYEIIKMARELLGEDVHIRLNASDSLGVGLANYLAALEAGVDGVDLALSPASGKATVPDMVSMLQATKGMNYNLGDLELQKILKYQEFLETKLSSYKKQNIDNSSSYILSTPMPLSELSLLRSNIDNRLLKAILEQMNDVIKKAGNVIADKPILHILWQQAYANVHYGPWKKIVKDYAKLILGYYGKTPVVPDPDIEDLAKEQLGLELAQKELLDIANLDDTKSINYFKNILEENSLASTKESIFILASTQLKGLDFLKSNFG